MFRRIATALLLPAAVPLLMAVVLLLGARLAPMPSWWQTDPTFASRSTLCAIRDRDGVFLALRRTADEAHLPVRIATVDPLLATATVAAEDRRFRLHPGVDLLATARAALQNARAGRRVSGGSTITQQLTKMCVDPAGARRDLCAKLREAWWSLVLDAHLSKDQILEAYWNRAPYGASIQGVGAAALLYFGREPDRLAPEEAALLAAIPRSPVRLDPVRNPEAARRARDRVLVRMGLSDSLLVAARERPLGLASAPTRGAQLAPHWLARVEAALPSAAVVTLPLDPALQERARAALASALSTLGARGADDAAALVIHNPTGEVRAWIGSPDWSHPAHGQVDATRARRQPGSALKPFTYALGFQAGLRPSSLLPDLPLEYASGTGSFRPRNYTGEYHGPVRVRAALANSWNAAAVALLSGIGPERLRLLLRAAGISTLERPGSYYGVGLTLGDAEVTLADLTNAYAALARGGTWQPRIEVREARAADGSLLRGPTALADSAEAPSEPTRLLDPRSAFFVTAILADPLARARAFGLDGPFSLPFPAAIKTGTSSDWRDNWAFGYTREWTVGTWVGRAGGGGMDRVSGTNGAILALRDILLFLEEGRPDRSPLEEFPPPAGVVERTICALSGMEAGPDCPETLVDWFCEEDPIGPVCTWHRRLALDISSGRLARTCTPPDIVRRVLFTSPDRLTESAILGIVPWSWEEVRTWGADRGWVAPPAGITECRCERPDCVPIDPPSAPAAQGGPPSLALADPAIRAHSILTAGRIGTNGHAEPGLNPGPGTGSATSGPARGVNSSTRSGRSPRCRIVRPPDRSIFALDPSLPRSQQQVALEASAGGGEVRWQVDGRDLGTTQPGERIFWPLEPGSHRIRAAAGTSPAEADEVRILVEEPS